MKKIFLSSLVAAGFLFFNAQAHAAATPDLAGNDYTIYMFCLKDVGDYCEKNKLEVDTFSFDKDSFSIKYFEDDDWRLAGNVGYSSSGNTFDASYTATKDISITGITKYKYTFKINGFIPVDNILLGSINIEYKEKKLPGDDTDESGQAFFLGIKD